MQTWLQTTSTEISFNTTVDDPIQVNEQQTADCKNNDRFFAECHKDLLLEKYITIRPKNHHLSRYCSFKVGIYNLNKHT